MKSSKKSSSLRQQVYLLQKEKNKIIWDLLDSLPVDMIAASISYVFRRCGKPGCKCQKGEKHGPYPAIQIKIKNKRTVKMIKKGDAEKVEKKVNEYKVYQEGLARINKLHREILALLQEARDKNLEEYP
jgi:hypothetical protein